MPKLSDIYGIDETSAASEVSSKALTPTKLTDPFDQSAQSRSAEDTLRLAETATAKATNTNRSDGRARTEGNHGKQG